MMGAKREITVAQTKKTESDVILSEPGAGGALIKKRNTRVLPSRRVSENNNHTHHHGHAGHERLQHILRSISSL
jgi:hypothetical protein